MYISYTYVHGYMYMYVLLHVYPAGAALRHGARGRLPRHVAEPLRSGGPPVTEPAAVIAVTELPVSP